MLRNRTKVWPREKARVTGSRPRSVKGNSDSAAMRCGGFVRPRYRNETSSNMKKGIKLSDLPSSRLLNRRRKEGERMIVCICGCNIEKWKGEDLRYLMREMSLTNEDNNDVPTAMTYCVILRDLPSLARYFNQWLRRGVHWNKDLVVATKIWYTGA